MRVGGSINSTMRRVIANAVKEGYIESDTTPSVRDGRLVIPVSPMFKRKISGIVHDESASVYPEDVDALLSDGVSMEEIEEYIYCG